MDLDLKQFIIEKYVKQWDYINDQINKRFINRLFTIHKIRVSSGGGYLCDVVAKDYEKVKHKIYKGNPIKCSLCREIYCYDTFEDYDNFEILCDSCDEIDCESHGSSDDD
jgi:hypothetical protein